MKFLFDLLPVILFFVAFKFAGIYVATGIAIATTIAQVLWMWLRHRKVEPMQWVSLAIIVVFGGATMLLHDETFIKWKPTALYWLFGITLFVIEHNMRVIMNLAEHIYCLANGRLLASGAPEAIQNDERVIEAYLGGRAH